MLSCYIFVCLEHTTHAQSTIQGRLYSLVYERETKKNRRGGCFLLCVFYRKVGALYFPHMYVTYTHNKREREKRDVCARVLPFVHFYLPTAVTLFATEINQCVSIIATIFAFTTRLCMSLTASFTEVAWWFAAIASQVSIGRQQACARQKYRRMRALFCRFQ